MKGKRMISLITALAVTAGALAGCAGGQTVSEHGSEGNQYASTDNMQNTGDAKGRYLESDMPLPEESGTPIGITWNENSLVLYTKSGSEEGGFLSYAYENQDWSDARQETWLTDGSQRLHLEARYLYQGRDGNLYALAESNAEDVPFGGHILKASEDGSSAQDVTPEALLKVNENGYTEMVSDLAILKDGTLCIGGYSNSVDFYKDGEKIQSLESTQISTNYQTMVSASDACVALISEDGKSINFYNAQDFKSIGSVSLDQSLMSARLTAGRDGAWYVINEKGIQRVTQSGTIVETIMSGSSGLMGAGTSIVKNFVTDGNETFYGLYEEEGTEKFKLKKYAFDENVPTVPTDTLSVYGLQENQTVAQAVYEFQSAHPEVKVEYNSAVSQGEAPSSDDIRTLNAELLSGGGADVLILDGLPLQAYIEKGILSDLTDTAESLGQSGVIMDVIGNTAAKEGSIYAIPARISVPIIYGTAEEVEACQSLENLHAYVQQHPEGALFGKDVHDTFGMTLFHTMYDELCKEDGSLDEQKLSQLISDWKQICESTGTKEFEEAAKIEGGSWKQMNMNFVSGQFYLGENFASIIEIKGLSSMMVPYAVMREKKQTAASLKSYYVPSAIAGVNASSKVQDLAKEFVETLFSEAVQESDNYDGFPVLKPALKALADYVETDAAGKMEMSSSMTDPQTGEVTYMEAGYPKRAEVEDIIGLIEGLSKPFLKESTILDTAMEEMENCYAGSLTAEEAARAICQKVDTYLAE